MLYCNLLLTCMTLLQTPIFRGVPVMSRFAVNVVVNISHSLEYNRCSRIKGETENISKIS